MADNFATTEHAGRRRSAFATAAAACALLSLAVAAGPAAAAQEQPLVGNDRESDHYQVYIGDAYRPLGAEGAPESPEREWGSIRLAEPGAIPPAGGLRSPSLIDGGSAAGVTYFTPSVSGVRVGVGLSGLPSEGATESDDASQYTALGPRVAPRDGSGNWQVGGKIGYSGLEIGANLGDHPDPTCEAGVACKTNDFWDIGVALRIGSGAISAAYTASQPRTLRTDEVDRIDVFSLNAGYKLTPGLNVYGGVDWIDLHSTGEAAETPVDTRFMFGTNLRF